ncbi:MAG TPA: HD domain-containing protein [Patescibacteria group bacterium]|nr:HD domain-containing protein [Patescibacteria group bacterium]
MTSKQKLEQIRKIVKEASEKSDNYFGATAYSYHIVPVVKYSLLLAEKLKANKEIIELSALLHDYSCLVNKDFYDEHHIHSSRLAEEILKKFGYPKEIIDKVKYCIFTHRASKEIKRESLEAKIVASADAMSHFSDVNSLFYLAFIIHKLDIEKGTKFVLNKLENSWKKVMPEGREIIKEKHDAIKSLFE